MCSGKDEVSGKSTKKVFTMIYEKNRFKTLSITQIIIYISNNKKNKTDSTGMKILNLN